MIHSLKCTLKNDKKEWSLIPRKKVNMKQKCKKILCMTKKIVISRTFLHYFLELGDDSTARSEYHWFVIPLQEQSICDLTILILSLILDRRA